MKRTLFGFTAAALLATGSASALIIGPDVTINEVLGNTTSTDTEFIELYNAGGLAQDLTGWSIEVWDSDSGASGQDGGAPYALSGSIAAGGFVLLGGPEFASIFGITPDIALPANAIENSSYTMILVDDSSNVIESIFVTDGGDGDAATRDGSLITPDATVGPDGSFLPAGIYRTTDGGASFGVLEFSPRPAPTATPGASNIPEPGSLALLGLGGLLVARRRRG